jgi:hypothetical protein
MCLTDDRDALVSVCRRPIVGADAHTPGTEFGDFECSEFSCRVLLYPAPGRSGCRCPSIDRRMLRTTMGRPQIQPR